MKSPNLLALWSLKVFSYFSVVVIISAALITGCGEKKNYTPDNKLPEVSADSTRPDNTGNVKGGTSPEGTDTSGEGVGSIVRQGIIEVASIDRNKDGKVYQCPMDWNVIDDKPGACPECKMDLEEVSITKARENLVRNNYQVR